MYRGQGPPLIIWKGQTITLPKPKKGGRSEKYDPLTKSYENLDGELVTGQKREFRFIAEYEFNNVPSDVLNSLIDIYNFTDKVTLVPHSDLTLISYPVIITEMTPDYWDGSPLIDSLKIKVKSKKIIRNL